MWSGVRRALGPGLRSWRRVYSLQGGADQRTPMSPLSAMRSTMRYWLSSSILKECPSARSKGAKQSACSACMALDRGACTGSLGNHWVGGSGSGLLTLVRAWALSVLLPALLAGLAWALAETRGR